MQLSALSKYKIVLKLSIPILVINAFGLCGLYLFMPRPLFYYEYAFVLIGLSMFKTYWPSFILFILIFFFDIFNLFSSLYLFQLNEFFASLSFIKLYHFTFQQVLLAVLFFAYLFFMGYILMRSHKIIQARKRLFTQILAWVYFTIVFLDMLSGSNKLTENFIQQNFVKKNIASSLVNDYVKTFSAIGNNKIEKLQDTSMGFKTFANDSSGNQLLIIVESWGELKDAKLQKALFNWISNKFETKGYNVQTGNSNYYGSTTAAGLRELTNTKGEYTYFINHKSDTTLFKSIFDIKYKQGYQTFGFHPFTGRMFSRSVWWKNIGIQQAYFRDDYIFENISRIKDVDGEAPFPSVKDEKYLDFLLDKTKSSPKKFVYYLTVNSHIPYHSITFDKDPDASFDIKKMKISDQAKYQLTHIKNLLEYFSQKIDAKEWNKILIVGDHTPPYPTARERNFYVEGKVPYLLITKKVN